MGGWLQCFRCDTYNHTHNGGAYINGENYCENCASEIEAHWLLKEDS